MSGHVLRTPDDDALFPIPLDHVWRGVAVITLGWRLVVTVHLPRELSVFLVERSHERSTPVHHGHDNELIRQYW